MRRRIREAIGKQERLAARVERRDRAGRIRRIGGADVGVRGRWAVGVVMVLDAATLEEVESVVVRAPVAFPYVPGLLAFREIPVLRRAWALLTAKPDLLMLDGQGIAHPRRCGLASHAGVVLGVPTIGVAKSILVGTHAELPRAKGSWTPLVDAGETVGAAVRTRDGVNPVYVSTGHRVSLATAIRWAVRTAVVRIPEPTRRADRLTRE